MNFESIKIRAETTYIRFRTLLRMVVGMAGLGLVLLGGYNMLLAPASGMETFAPYRVIGAVLIDGSTGGYFLGDVMAIGVGAILTWVA